MDRILKKEAFIFLLLNSVALLIYSLVVYNLKVKVTEDIFFLFPDSISYLNVANWLEKGIETNSLGVRPFLYPLLLLVFMKINGIWGVWFMQAVMWLLSVNFTFISIRRLTKNIKLAYFGALIFMSNISLISYTFHGLTEVCTTFFLSLMIFVLVKIKTKYTNISFGHCILFFLSILTIIKPVFYYFFCAILVIHLLCYNKQYLKFWRNFAWLILAVSPIILQLSVINSKYDKIVISDIGSRAFDNYFFSKGLSKVESIGLQEARERVDFFTQSEKLEVIKNNKIEYVKVFLSTVMENVTTHSMVSYYPERTKSYNLARFMKGINVIFFVIHILFFFPVCFVIYSLFERKKYDDLIIVLFLFFLSLYYIFTTGVSFDEGDRLVLPSEVIWICVYLFAFSRVAEKTNFFNNESLQKINFIRHKK